MSDKVYNFSNEPTGTHALLLGEINSGSTVLDVGCASGYLGQQLVKEKDCQVWGIEPEPAEAAEARDKGYQKVVQSTVEEALNNDEINSRQYDAILVGDVFEHLVYPEKILKQLQPLLKPEGRLVTSFPNVAHYSIRWQLLKGNWDMKDSGIMDRTHLHFYTLKTLKQLFRQTGWEVEKVRPRGDLERWFRKIGLEWIGRKLLLALPKPFSIQFVFTLKKSTEAV